MEKSKAKTQRLAAIVIIAFNIVGIGLVLYDLAYNISYEIQSQGDLEAAVQEVTPTPVPTLTEEERREIFEAPVGEEGGE
jgi:uncharacterized membrane protein